MPSQALPAQVGQTQKAVGMMTTKSRSRQKQSGGICNSKDKETENKDKHQTVVHTSARKCAKESWTLGGQPKPVRGTDGPPGPKISKRARGDTAAGRGPTQAAAVDRKEQNMRAWGRSRRPIQEHICCLSPTHAHNTRCAMLEVSVVRTLLRQDVLERSDAR